MNIGNSSGPQRCTLCLRDRDEAIREHVASKRPCCAQCPLSNIINDALRNPGRYNNIIRKRESGKPKQQSRQEETKNQIIQYLVWAVVGLIVYLVTYEAMGWERVWAIVAAVFWPITLCVAFFYYVGGYIISLF